MLRQFAAFTIYFLGCGIVSRCPFGDGVCVCVCVCVCVRVCVCVCVGVWVCGVCVYAYMYTRINKYIYIYVCYTHTLYRCVLAPDDIERKRGRNTNRQAGMPIYRKTDRLAGKQTETD